MNSYSHDWRGGGSPTDRLQDPRWLARFMEVYRLPTPSLPDAAEMQALTDLRGLLRRMTEAAMAGLPLDPRDLEGLNRVLAQGPVVRQVPAETAAGAVTLLPVRQDWGQAMAEIAASFAETLATGDPARIRMCANPDCRWIFYDDTRSRTKRFCEERTCGNLMKVRRFRERQKSAAGDGRTE